MKLFLWQKYIYQEILKFLFFFLFCAFFFFFVIDYTLNLQSLLSDRSFHHTTLIYYYLCVLLKRLDVLLPIALLITTIKVLMSLNRYYELLSLQAGGINIQKIARCFMVIGIISSCFLVVNNQWILPKSSNFIDQFVTTHMKKRKKEKQQQIHALYLADGSKLIYRSYHPSPLKLEDVFLMTPEEGIWHMKTLQEKDGHLLGEFVDHFQRNDKKFIEKIGSHREYIFSSLNVDLFHKQNPYFTSFENRSISSLLYLLYEKPPIIKSHKAQIQAHLYSKLINPWLCLFVILAVFPYCIIYRRGATSFFLYAFAFFSLIAFFTFRDTCLMLGETHTLPPYMTILILPGIIYGIITYRFYRTC